MPTATPATVENPFERKRTKKTETPVETPVEVMPEDTPEFIAAANGPSAAPLPNAGPQTPNIPVIGSEGPTASGPTVENNPFVSGRPGELPDDFIIDLTGVEVGQMAYIRPGRHLVYCDSISQGTAKSGNPKIVFSFTIGSGEFIGKKRPMHVAVIENQLWKFKEIALALGISMPDDKLSVGAIRAEAVGRVAIGEFTESTYNGQPTTDFARVLSPEEANIPAGTTYDQLQRGEV